MAEDKNLPASADDNQSTEGPSEQELLDAVMKNSPIMNEVEEVPLPDEEVSEEVPEESTTEDDQVEEESEIETESEETAEETEGEDVEETTEVPEVYAAEDLDLDAKVKVKIDGKESEVTFQDLLKGYQTDQSLTNKGRELGEARKALDEERASKLEEVNKIAQATSAISLQAEQGFQKEYHELETAIAKARKDGDTFEMNELKDKREQVQKNYWAARNQREGLIKAVENHNKQLQEEQWQKQIENFQKEIPNYIPDFNTKMAGDIREFMLKEGIDAAVLDNIVDPKIVKVMNDYRQLKQGVTKGTAKRKAIPTKKVPAKKATPAQKKEQDRAAMVKARAFKEDASADDQMAFLRQHASRTLNL